MRAKSLKLIALIVMSILSLSLMAACGNNDDGGSTDVGSVNGGQPAAGEIAAGDNDTQKVNIQVVVRDAYFADAGERNLMYDGKVVCATEDGEFTASVEVGAEGFDKSKLSTDRANCNFIVTEAVDSLIAPAGNGIFVYTVIEVEEGSATEGFMNIGGKVVLHSDGETRVSGATLCIDGNVAIEKAQGDFNINYVPVGAKFSALYDGYETVDILQNKLQYHVITDGVEVYTFRLVPATN